MRNVVDDKSNVVGRISLVLTVANAIVVVASVAVSLIKRRQFFDVFTDFGVALPAGTVLFLRIPWIVWLAATVSLVAMLVCKEFITRKWIPLCVNLVFAWLIVGYWVVFYIVMVVPFLQLIHRLETN